MNSKSKSLEFYLAAIDKLTGVTKGSVFHQKIPVHLVMSSKSQKDQVGWFSILDGQADLVLECSGVAKTQQSFLELIILHEYFHLALRQNEKLFAYIRDHAKMPSQVLRLMAKELLPSQVIEELLISSFVPEGYLGALVGKKMVGVASSIKKNNAISFVLARRFFAYKLRLLAKDYIEKNKPIDDNYLRSLTELIKTKK